MPRCVCGRDFASDLALKDHQASWSSSSSSKPSLACSACPLVFCTKAQFDKHKHVPCPECKADFPTVQDLLRHASAKLHWKCGRCGARFRSQALLNKHAKTVTHTADAAGAGGAVGSATGGGADVVSTAGAGKRSEEDAAGNDAVQGAGKNPGKGRVQCAICTRQFKSEAALAQHSTDSRQQHDKVRRREAEESRRRQQVQGQKGAVTKQQQRQQSQAQAKAKAKAKSQGQPKAQASVQAKPQPQQSRAQAQQKVAQKQQHTQTQQQPQPREEKKKKKKKKKKTNKKNLQCEDCGKGFEKEADLSKHARSLAHRPLSDLGCIAGLFDSVKSGLASGAGCTACFTSPSAMLLHLESGSCSSGIDREKLNAIIGEEDTRCVIRKRIKASDGHGIASALDRLRVDDRNTRALDRPPIDNDDGHYEIDDDVDDDGNDDNDDNDNDGVQALARLRLDDGDGDDDGAAQALDRLRLDDGGVSASYGHRLGSNDFLSDPPLLLSDARPMTPAMSESTDSGGVILTPGSEVSVPTPYLHLAAVPSMRCPLCPGKQRKFPSMLALSQHMQSAAHTATREMYHCPLSLLAGELGGCGIKRLAEKLEGEGRRRFSTASGLVQHLESGACVGGEAALRVAMGYLEERLLRGGLAVDMLCSRRSSKA